MSLAKKRVVFAGVARNCSWFLPNVLENLTRLAALYDDAAYVIAENDSDDDTKAILQSWLSCQTQGHLLELDGLAATEPKRTQRIATARNACLDKVRSTYRDYDHLVMLDLDNVNSIPLSTKAFCCAARFLEITLDAAGVFANQRSAYFDVWALRHDLWCSGDCWKQVQGRPRWMPQWAAVILYVHRRQVSVPTFSSPILVHSAFGGLGIYKMSKILECRYDGLHKTDGSEVCEHIELHRQICARKGRLFIYPRLLNQAPTEHLFDPQRFGRGGLFLVGLINVWHSILAPWKRYIT